MEGSQKKDKRVLPVDHNLRRKKRFPFKFSVTKNLQAWRDGLEVVVVGGEEDGGEETSGIKNTIYDQNLGVLKFPPSLTANQRHLIHEIALSLGLFHASNGEGNSRCVLVAKHSTLLDFSESSEGSRQNPYYNEKACKPTNVRPFLQGPETRLGIKQALSRAVSASGVHPDFQFLHLKGAAAKELTKNKLFKSGECVDLETPLVFVDTLDALVCCAEALSLLSEIAFDCEMHQFRSYFGITCSIQFSGGGVDYIVDTLALWEHINPILGPIFANPKIIKIGHAIMGGDVPSLNRDFGILIVSSFCTQVNTAHANINHQREYIRHHHTTLTFLPSPSPPIKKGCQWIIGPQG